MLMTQQQAIRDRTAALMVDWANDRRPPFTGDTADGFVEAIEVAHLVADEGRVTLHRWVDAARRTGVSWTEVGTALGISKQAAQQRFRSGDLADEQAGEHGEEVVRLGASAFNEMAILREEGRKGRELMRTGALTLVFRSTPRAWEYRRRFGAAAMPAEMARAGWTHVSSWLPFHYFKRPVGDD